MFRIFVHDHVSNMEVLTIYFFYKYVKSMHNPRLLKGLKYMIILSDPHTQKLDLNIVLHIDL